MSKKQTHIKLNPTNLHNLSTQQLKTILRELENQHDIIQAKNQQLATHVSDIRTVIKQVQKQKQQQLNYTLNKKKKLQNQIQRCQAALKIANSKDNTMYADMVAFKELNEGN